MNCTPDGKTTLTAPPTRHSHTFVASRMGTNASITKTFRAPARLLPSFTPPRLSQEPPLASRWPMAHARCHRPPQTFARALQTQSNTHFSFPEAAPPQNGCAKALSPPKQPSFMPKGSQNAPLCPSTLTRRPSIPHLAPERSAPPRHKSISAPHFFLRRQSCATKPQRQPKIA